jgi:hypothetical protein
MLDKITSRITELEQNLQQAIANYNAINGALLEARSLFQLAMQEMSPKSDEQVIEAETLPQEETSID